MSGSAPSISDTIVAVASGWRPAPRAIIRMSGPGTHTLCRALFSPVPERGGAILATSFCLSATLAFPCLLIRFDGPHSYTGEDAAEIVLPGNPLLLERVAARLTSHPGVREASPGEFSARSYLAGRMTLSQAEGVAALITAESDDQLAAANALMSGRTGERHRHWADEVAALLALVEAGIDFTDQEDVVPITPATLAARLDAVLQEVAGQLGNNAGAERTRAMPRVVLVGPPNAGKSTLFNALLGRSRAIVSPVAGTTRDAIVEELDLADAAPAGVAVELVDVAGLDTLLSEASVVDQHAQAQAVAELQRADVLVFCDPRGRFDSQPAATRAPAMRPVIRVRTKADLPAADHAAPDVIGVCALDGWNLRVLRRAIADAAAGSAGQTGSWLLPRHRRTLGAARESLERARSGLDPAAHALAAPELVASELRAALDQLGELVGDISPDDIIGRVFATFCVGK